MNKKLDGYGGGISNTGAEEVQGTGDIVTGGFGKGIEKTGFCDKTGW